MNANNFSIFHQFSMVVVRDKYTKDFRIFTLILQKKQKEMYNFRVFFPFFLAALQVLRSFDSWVNCAEMVWGPTSEAKTTKCVIF